MKQLVLVLTLLVTFGYSEELIIKEPPIMLFGKPVVRTSNCPILTGNDGHQYYKEGTAEGDIFLHLPSCKKCRIQDSLLLVNVLKTLIRK